MMKKTLLNEVQDIERDASAVVAQAKERVADELVAIRRHKEATELSIREKAEKTSKAIITERVRASQEEAHEIVAQSQSIASQIHGTAENNRSRAIEKATMLFNEEYGTKL